MRRQRQRARSMSGRAVSWVLVRAWGLLLMTVPRLLARLQRRST